MDHIVFADPVSERAGEPKDKGASEKLVFALGKLIKEDPSFQVDTD